jgi:fatty acid omega-hydroxylase
VLDLVNILKKASNENATVDFARIFKRLTLDTFASIGYGVELGCLKSNESQPFEFALNDAMRIVMKRFVVPNWYWKLQRFLGIGDEAAMKKNLQVIDSMIYDIITKSLASKRQQQSSNTNTPADIVTLFINPHESESEGNLNPKFIRDVVVSFLLAGRDTVGDALSWVFFCMMKYPDVADKIREELRTKISRLFTSSELKPPTWEECQELVYLEAVLMEIMRLYPPISLNHKYAQYDTVLSDGTFIKKGTNVILPAYAQGRLPSVWGPDANVFRPERWIDPKTNSLHQESAYKFSIFNAGPRACPGKQFAMMELKMVTSTLLSQFAFQRVPTNGSGRRADDVGRGDDNDTPSYAVTITLSMLRSMPVNITPFIQSQKC